MSRIGRQPVKIPEGVVVDIEANKVVIKGPKGEITRIFPKVITIEKADDEIKVSLKKVTNQSKALFGTTRSHIANMVSGVSEGWQKTLQLVGTGYRGEVKADTLVLTVGYSHPVKVQAPAGISFKAEKTDVTVEGADKEVVGAIAAKIRAIRPPEPYKGKGIKYKGEVIRRKAGKAAKTVGAA